ncbi:hypothetical protein DOZ80_10575 [Pseudomonas fluorescens]|uniref:Uncharacterized protein n=1 Tax=Pseudomonas fluorescens TaxID=294 RepID=A0A327N9L3_PSEFL|nr:hypothetical protein [Pseudomonas fluorescens]RAI70904.1 hypothetical protein DOZ80_10575 [Pseudomonas fluorescens]
MNRDLESSVWRLAQQRCAGSEFLQLIEDAVSRYKRVPGFDLHDRLHASEIGLPGVKVLRDVLERYGFDAGPPGSYVEIRSRLRAHLSYQLQWHLVSIGQATDEMKEDQLGRDLGM